MSNSNGVVKCNNCGKIFFNNDNDICPFCGKSLNELSDIFKGFFGNQNNQGESDGLY